METAENRVSRRMGWSDTEEKLLWETAEEAHSKGLPLKAVFDHIADRTGRKPNSIRNYYYQQVRAHEGDQPHAARFVPFTQEEVEQLMREVLIATGQGQSVRSCLSRISGGDHSLMLRYQNKYRSVIKSRPEYVQLLVDQLQSEGISCAAPSVNHRSRADFGEVSRALTTAARRTGEPEIVRACETLLKLIEGSTPDFSVLTRAAEQLLLPIKDFLAHSPEEQQAGLPDFLETLTQNIGLFESALPAVPAEESLFPAET